MYHKEGKLNYRWNLVKTAEREGISEATRLYKTTRKTVRKWLSQYKEEGVKGLENKSRLQQKFPNRIPDDITAKILETRRKHMNWGARRIIEQMNLPYSHSTVHKKLKQAGLIQKKKKRYMRRRDMSQIRKKYGPFQKIQVDVKYLTDMPELAAFLRWNNLPLYQITARDYRTGAQFIGYSYDKTSTATGIFIDYLCNHLQRSGINLEKSVFQTDNGSEFVSKSLKRKSLFEDIVTKKFKATHKRIPPARPTYNSDVESAHRLIEDELYCVEEYSSERDFMIKAFSYQVYFNRFRGNRNRENKTPLEILTKCKKMAWQSALDIQPIIVDRFYGHIERIKTGGYFYCVPPKKLSSFS